MKAYDPGTVEVTADVAKVIKAMFRDRLETVDNKCIDINMGEEVRRTGLENGAAFFRIDVKQSDVENGFFFFCRNNARDTLKLVLFNADGDKVHVHSPNKAWSQGAMYFTAFEIYKVAGTGSVRSSDSKASKDAFSSIVIPEDHEDPALEALSALDGMSSSKGTVSAGKHLLCVLGSHRIRDAAFTLSAVPAQLSDPAPVQGLQEADKELLSLRSTLQASKAEYQQVKAAYLASLDRVAEEETHLHTLLGKKNLCYENFVDACLKESNLPARTTPLPQPKPPVQPQRPPAQSSALGSATQPAAAAVRGKEIIMARYIYFDDDDESAEEFYVSQQQQQKVSQHEPAAAVSESAQPSTTPAAPVASTFSPTVAQHSAAAPAVVAVSAASHAASSAPAAAPSATASGNGGKSMLRFIYSDEDDDAEASATPAQSAAPAPAVQSAAPAPVVKSVAPVSHAVSTALAPASAAPVASAVHAPTPVAAAATVSRTPTRAAEPAASSAPVSVPGSSGSKSLCRFIYADEEDEEAGPAAAAPSTAESTEDPSSKPSVQIPTEASPAKHVHWPAQVDADQIEIAARDEQQDASSEGGPVLSVFHPTETSVTAVLEELSPASPSPRPVFAEETAQLEETEIFSVCPQEGEGHAAQVASREAVAVEEEAEVVQPVQLASAFADVEEQPQQQEDLQDASEFVDEPVLLQETVIAEQAVDKEGALEAIDDLVVLTESVSLAVTEAAVEIAAAEPEQEPASEAAAEEAPALEPVEEPVPAHSAAAVDEAPKQQPVKQDPVPASAPSAFSLAPPAPADTSSKASKKKRKNKKKKKGGSTPVEDDVNCDNEAETPQLEDGETGNSPVPESSSAGEPQSAPQEPAAASDAVAAEPAIAAEAPFVDPAPQEVEKEKVVIGATEEEERVVIGATEEEERAGEATSLDGTLNNSADFADALDGLPASVLASKTGAAAAGAQKMVWKAHPEAVDQQPVPMVWHLQASADTTAESVAVEKETSAVAGAESKPDSSNGHSSIAKEPVHTTPDTKKVPAVSAKVEAAKPSTANQQQQSASPAPSKRPTDPAAAARALAAMNAFTDSVKPKAATAPTPPLAHQQARSIPASSPHGVASLASHSNGSANSNTAKAPTWNFAPPAGDTWDFTPSTSSAQPQKASTDASFAPTSPSVWSSPSATLQPACTTPSSGGMPQMTRGYSSNTTSPMQWAGTPPMRPLSSGQIRTGAAGLPGAVASPAAPIVQANKKYLDMSDPFAGL